MIYDYKSYRSYLKEVLAQKQRDNSAYSLRAMALKLGFSSSQLSEALSGKANFSIISLKKIAKKLKLSSVESKYLCLLGELENEKDPEARSEIMAKLQTLNPTKRSVQDLSVDQFKQMSDWYYSAILELVQINGFKFSPENVAQKIGISRLEAELAIERLMRLEFIEVDELGKYKRHEIGFQIRSEVKNAAMRNFYRQMFQKASVALDEQSPQERWSGYETIPVSKASIPEVRAACDAFFEQVLAISSKQEKKEDVYHLLVHFFNLTPERKKP